LFIVCQLLPGSTLFDEAAGSENLVFIAISIKLSDLLEQQTASFLNACVSFL